jgi:hypothetical protein
MAGLDPIGPARIEEIVPVRQADFARNATE